MLQGWRYSLSILSALLLSITWHTSTYYANRWVGEKSRYAGIFQESDEESGADAWPWQHVFYYSTLTITTIMFQLVPFVLMLYLLRKSKAKENRWQSDGDSEEERPRDGTKELPFLLARGTARCFSLDLLAHVARVALEYYRLTTAFQGDQFYSLGVTVCNLLLCCASSLHLFVYLRAYCAQPLESFGYFKTESEENFEIALARSSRLRTRSDLHVSSV